MLTEEQRRRGWRALAAMALCTWLSGCGAGYLLQAAHGQWRVMRARVPIARVIASPGTPAPLARRLAMVQAARAWAVRELALPDNASYTRYAALGRPYAVWNVVAAPAFSTVPRHWCFPFTGCISYRGYFHEAAARRYAARLAARGDDVLVAGVTAYSTLGHFADPVLDTLLARDDATLVGTIFHELAHQVVYVPGETAFNEAYAMAVERAGVSRWLAAQGRAAEAADWRRRQVRLARSAALLAAGRARLAALYAAGGPVDGLRAAKQAGMARIARELRDEEAATGEASGYGPWLDAGLNNAHLAAVATYFDCVPGFQRLLESVGGSFGDFHAAVRALARGPAAARRALCPGTGAAPPGPAG